MINCDFQTLNRLHEQCQHAQLLHGQLLNEHVKLLNEHTDLKRNYRTALDEILALKEKNDELREKIDLQDVIPISFAVPNAMVLKDELPFEKKVLSLGMFGKIRDPPNDFNAINYQYDGEDLPGDISDFKAQFGPMIIEEVRSKAASCISKLEKSNPPPVVGLVDSIRFPEEEPHEQRRSRNQSKGKHQVNFGFVRIDCTTQKKSFPELKDGFFKELLCVVLPSVDTKKLNIVFAIGTQEYDSESKQGEEKFVKYSIMMLEHDFGLLSEHARNVLRKQNPSADFSDPLKRVSWHHITGLIPSARMYEAVSPSAPLLFADQILLQEEVTWPNPRTALELHKLNLIQAEVVQSMACTSDTGLFRLIGPPGAGKTTTSTRLELERIRQFPTEKILSTAPSNKAIQVLLHKVVEMNTEDFAIAVIGTNKNIPAEHESLYAAEFTAPMRKRLRQLYHAARNKRKIEFKTIVTAVADSLEHLTDPARPGLPVERPVREAVMDVTKKFLHYDFSTICNKESLDEHILNCIDDLRDAADCIERFILQRAQVVFSTLVSAGRKNFYKAVPHFDTVIVDEASQALVPATFIPFKFRPKLYLLVGDPQQLPATVQADHLKIKGFADSLMLVMDREMVGSACAKMLTTQYRMSPSICKPISDLFYGGKLVTAESVVNRPCLLQKHLPAHMLLRDAPCAFIDVESIENHIDGGSSSNDEEASVVVKVVKYLLQRGATPGQIGIVSGYSLQVELLQKLLWEENELKQRNDFADFAVSTVDGFQGDEKDFMLFSCVRTCTSVGFLNDARRINVAMSRGRHANWVFGQARTLRESNSTIRDFLEWTDDGVRNCITPCTREITADALFKSMEAQRFSAHSTSPHEWDASFPRMLSAARGPPAVPYISPVESDNSVSPTSACLDAAAITEGPPTASPSSVARALDAVSVPLREEEVQLSAVGNNRKKIPKAAKVSLQAPSLLTNMRRK